MAALSDFERFVAPFVPDAPIPALHDAVLDASIEFCIRARPLRQVMPALTITPGTPEIEIEAEQADTQIVEVLAAWLPEGKLQAMSRADLDALYPQGWQDVSVAESAQIRGFYCRAPGLIRLVPALNQKAAKALTLDVNIAPMRTAQDVPDLLLERYAEVIASGALTRLHQHAAPYADAGRAVSYLQRFEALCAALADESTRGHQHAPLRIISEHW